MIKFDANYTPYTENGKVLDWNVTVDPETNQSISLIIIPTCAKYLPTSQANQILNGQLAPEPNLNYFKMYYKGPPSGERDYFIWGTFPKVIGEYDYSNL